MNREGEGVGVSGRAGMDRERGKGGKGMGECKLIYKRLRLAVVKR